MEKYIFVYKWSRRPRCRYIVYVTVYWKGWFESNTWGSCGRSCSPGCASLRPIYRCILFVGNFFEVRPDMALPTYLTLFLPPDTPGTDFSLLWGGQGSFTYNTIWGYKLGFPSGLPPPCPWSFVFDVCRTSSAILQYYPRGIKRKAKSVFEWYVKCNIQRIWILNQHSL